MGDPELRWYQQEIQNRAAELRAIAAEMELDLGRVVARSRELRRQSVQLRDERYGSPWTERASKLDRDR